MMSKCCKYCGKEFRIKPSHYDIKFYCSKACMAQDYKIRMSGENNPNYRNGGLKKCLQCGKEFYSYEKKLFCSMDCYSRSDLKRKISIEANNSTRKPDNHCSKCGIVISKTRKRCDDCLPKKTHHYCEICGKETKVARHCKECKKILPKKDRTSTCQIYGTKIDKPYRKYCASCWRMVAMTKRGVPRKVDANQGEIVDALRKIGASIIDLSAVGGGAPDLAVGFLGKTYLLEVKNPKTKGKLNKLQQKWHDEWKGSVYVVYSAEEAIGIVREDCFI